MRKLLQDALDELRMWVYCEVDYTEHIGSAEALMAKLQTALASLQPGASHAEAILAHADGLEDEGDGRAEAVRTAMNGVSVDAVADAIHQGLGGNGWAYSNYGGDERNDCREMLLGAAVAAMASMSMPTSHQPSTESA